MFYFEKWFLTVECSARRKIFSYVSLNNRLIVDLQQFSNRGQHILDLQIVWNATKILYCLARTNHVISNLNKLEIWIFKTKAREIWKIKFFYKKKNWRQAILLLVFTTEHLRLVIRSLGSWLKILHLSSSSRTLTDVHCKSFTLIVQIGLYFALAPKFSTDV